MHFFPVSANFSDERLKGLIESQNDGINTNGWNILNRTNANKHAEWKLYLDEESLRTLADRNFVLNFRFGETQLRKVKTQGRSQDDGNTNGNEPELNVEQETTPNDLKTETSGAKMEALTEAVNYKRSQLEVHDRLIAPPKRKQERITGKNEAN